MLAVAVLLAAGEGRRMGLPKALLDAGGATFLEALSRTFEEAGCRVLAVVGADAATVRARHAGAWLVENAGWQRGQFSSARVGILAALEAGADAVLVHPVDAPLLRADTVRAVLGAMAGHDGAVPVHRGRPGHPLALTRKAAERVLAGDAPHLEAAQRGLDVVRVHVDDAGAIDDVDTPEAYEKTFGSPPKRG